MAKGFSALVDAGKKAFNNLAPKNNKAAKKTANIKKQAKTDGLKGNSGGGKSALANEIQRQTKANFKTLKQNPQPKQTTASNLQKFSHIALNNLQNNTSQGGSDRGTFQHITPSLQNNNQQGDGINVKYDISALLKNSKNANVNTSGLKGLIDTSAYTLNKNADSTFMNTIKAANVKTLQGATDNKLQRITPQDNSVLKTTAEANRNKGFGGVLADSIGVLAGKGDAQKRLDNKTRMETPLSSLSGEHNIEADAAKGNKTALAALHRQDAIDKGNIEPLRTTARGFSNDLSMQSQAPLMAGKVDLEQSNKQNQFLNTVDKNTMNEEDYNYAKTLTSQYTKAKDVNDTIGMQNAERQLKTLRGWYGYDENTPVTNTGKAKSMASSIDETTMAARDRQASEQAKQDFWAGEMLGNKDMQNTAHKEAEAVRSKYGYSGGNEGVAWNPSKDFKKYSEMDAPPVKTMKSIKSDKSETTTPMTTEVAYLHDASNDQVKQYNYIFNTQGRKSANDYLNTVIKPSVNSKPENQFNTSSQAAEDLKSHPILSNIASIADTGLSSLGAFENAANYARYGEVDNNSLLNQMTQYKSDIRQQTSDKIKNPALNFGYQAGMASADSIATGMFGKAGFAMMVTDAANQSLVSKLESGASVDDAVKFAVVAGAVEYATEKLPFERIQKSLGHQGKFAAKDLKQYAKNVLEQYGIEGSEELVAEIADNMADDVIFGEDSERNQYKASLREQGYSEKEAEKASMLQYYIANPVESFLVGGLSGGMTAGGAMAIGRYNAGANIQDNGLAETLINKGLELNDPKGKQIAEKLQNGNRIQKTKLADLKVYIQEDAYNSLKNLDRQQEIYDYVGADFDAPKNKYAETLRSKTDRDIKEFSSKDFTQGWILRSQNMIDEIEAYSYMTDEEKNSPEGRQIADGLQEYKSIAEDLYYSGALNENVASATGQTISVLNAMENSTDVFAEESNSPAENNTVEAQNIEEVSTPQVQNTVETENVVENQPQNVEAATEPDNMTIQPQSISNEQMAQEINQNEHEDISQPENSFNVGKIRGNTVTYHSSAENVNKSTLVENAKQAVGNINYDIVQVQPEDGTVTFIETEDFDGQSEPVVISKTQVNADGTVENIPVEYGKQIISDKAEYVPEDYTGFDVKAAKERQDKWQKSGKKYNVNKVNNADYFNETFNEELNTNTEPATAETSDAKETENNDIIEETENATPTEETIETKAEELEFPSSTKFPKAKVFDQLKEHFSEMWGSKETRKGLKFAIDEIYDYAKELGTIDYVSDEVDELMEFATEKISYIIYNDAISQEMTADEKDFLDYLKKTPIKVSDDIRNGITDFSDFKKRNMGTLHFSQGKGKSVDIIYEEVKGLFGNYVNPDISNEADIVMELSEIALKIRESNKETILNAIFEGNKEEANIYALHIANTIIDYGVFDGMYKGGQNEAKNNSEDGKGNVSEVRGTESRNSTENESSTSPVDTVTEEETEQNRTEQTTEEVKPEETVQETTEDVQETENNVQETQDLASNKEEIINRLNALAEASSTDTVTYKPVMVEWSKKGKNRTYFKLSRSENGKTKRFAYGYFDNANNIYSIEENSNYGDLTADSVVDGDNVTHSFADIMNASNAPVESTTENTIEEPIAETATEPEKVAEPEPVTTEKTSPKKATTEKPKLEVGDIFEYENEQYRVTKNDGFMLSAENIDETSNLSALSWIGSIDEHDYKLITKNAQETTKAKENKEDVQRENKDLHGDIPAGEVQETERVGETGRSDNADSQDGEHGLAGKRTGDAGSMERNGGIQGSTKESVEVRQGISDDTVSSGGDSKGRDRTVVQNRFYIPRGLTENNRQTAYNRTSNNVNAIKTLKNILAENRTATDEEKLILSKYSGWGGLSGVFNKKHEHYSTLKELLTEKEFDSGALSSATAYYTPLEVIDGVYKIADRLGLGTNANVLEQACGSGSFFGYMPHGLRESSSITAVELDTITGNIARLLYDDIDVNVQDYTEFNRKGYNLIVGNVPFGTISLYDKNYKKESNNYIHDYFIAKGLRTLQPGGIMVVVTSKGTLDKTSNGARQLMSDSANLIGAIRMPDNTFSDSNTNVVSDILIFQKKGEGVNNDLAQDFLNVESVEIDGKKMSVNEYFVKNPEMVLGDMKAVKNRYSKDVYTVKDNGSELSDVINTLPSAIYTEAIRKNASTLNEEAETAAQKTIETTEVRNTGALEVIDGEVYRYNKEGEYEKFEPKKQRSDAIDADRLERIKGMNALLKERTKLIELENTDATDAEVKKGIEKLNKMYDAYTKKYGALTDRKNKKAYEGDSNYGRIEALENTYKVNNKTIVEKNAIFSERVVRPIKEITNVKSSKAALEASLALTHSVDLDYMSKIYGKSKDTIVSELEDRLFESPTDKGRYILDEEYLSGNVKQKLAEAKAALPDNPDMIKNVSALESVVPADISSDDISSGVTIGASWIDESYVTEFAQRLYGGNVSVHYSNADSRWYVHGTANKDSENHYSVAGKGGSALEIFEDVLNSKKTEIRDRDGAHLTEATSNAAVKQDDIKREFSNWLFSDASRTEALVRKYNDTFNNYVEREINVEHIEAFPGQSPAIDLKPHQKKAVLKAVYQNSLLMVHSVGAGKTFAMIASAQEMKRLGIANKPLMVVPKEKVADFTADYLKLYPAANILTLGEDDFNASSRNRMLATIEQGNFDCIIMKQSAFDRFPLSAEALTAYKDGELAKFRNAINQESDNDSKKKLEETLKSYEAKLNKMIDASVGQDYNVEVFFDKCGIDALICDEAHYFKNLFFYSKQQVSGITGDKITNKTLHLHAITELMHKRGNHIIFGTATPTTNSLAEFYTMQKYLQPEKLREIGAEAFDSWCSIFGEMVSKAELNTTGQGAVVKTRFAKLKNISDLMRILRQNFDFVTAKDIALKTPAAKITHIKAQSSTLLYHLNKMLDKDSVFPHKTGKNGRTIDNTLSNYTCAKMAAVDLRLCHKVLIDAKVIPEGTPVEALDMPDSKLNKAVNNVFDTYQKTTDILGTQIIFLDQRGQGKLYNYDLYKDMKNKLIKMGVKPSEIAIAQDYSDDKKVELSQKMNDGEIRVLIGSSTSAGTGINVQRKIVAMHHIDAPQRPADLTQRNGRGIRQGNDNKEIDVYYYSTMNSYDAPMWGMIDRKEKGISEVMNGDPNIREVDDSSLDDIFGGLSVAAANNPVLFEMTDAKEKKDKLEAKLRNFNNEQSRDKSVISNYDKTKATYNKRVEIANKAKAFISEHSKDKMKVGNQTFANDKARDASKAAYDTYDKLNTHQKMNDNVIGQINGINIIAHTTYETGTFTGFFVRLEGVPWVTDIPFSTLDANGLKTNPDAMFKSPLNMYNVLSDRLVNGESAYMGILENNIADFENTYQAAKKNEGKTFTQEKELQDISKRYYELEQRMKESESINNIAYNDSLFKAGDFTERIPATEAEVEQIGYIERGKGYEDTPKEEAQKLAKDVAEKAKAKKSASKAKNASTTQDTTQDTTQAETETVQEMRGKGNKETDSIKEKPKKATATVKKNADEQFLIQDRNAFFEKLKTDEKDFNLAREQKANSKIKKLMNGNNDISSLIRAVKIAMHVNITSHNYKKRIAQGYFVPAHNQIRVKKVNDLTTVLHEMGHKLDKLAELSKEEGIKEMLNNAPKVRETLTEAGYSEEEMLQEVAADFVRAYMVDPDGAREYGSYAGNTNLVDTFESKMKDINKLSDIQSIRKYILDFETLSTSEKMKTTIKHRGDKNLNMSDVGDKLRGVYRKLFSENEGLEYLDKQLRKANGASLSPTEQVALKAEYASNADSITETMIEGNYIRPDGQINYDQKGFQELYRPLFDIKVNGKRVNAKEVQEDFDLYLKNQHTLDWAIQGKDVYSADVADITDVKKAIDDAEAKYGDTFKEVADNIYNWWDTFMQDWMIDTGLLSEESYALLKKLNPHYVPNFRVMDKKGGTLSKSSNSIMKRSSKHGNTGDTYSATENLIMKANQIISGVLNNEVNKTIHKLYQDGSEETREVMGYYFTETGTEVNMEQFDATELKERLKEKLGNTDEMAQIVDDAISDMVTFAVPQKYSKAGDVIAVNVDGKTHFYKVADSNMLYALQQLSSNAASDMLKLINKIGKLTRAFSALTTSSNPLFVLNNAARDIQHGYVMTQSKEINGIKDYANISYAVDWIKSLIEEIGYTVYRTDSAKKQRADKGQIPDKFEMQQLYHSQNEFATRYMPKNDVLGDTMKSMYKQGYRKIFSFGSYVKFINTVSNIIETTSRMPAFKRAYEQTKGTAQDKLMAATKASRNATVDFHRSGTIIKPCNKVIPFINAAMAGLDNTAKMVLDSNVSTDEKVARVARAVIPAFIVIMLTQMLYGDDDDYDKISDYVKNNYWLFRVGDEETGTWVRVPKDREIAALFGTSIQKMVGYAVNPDKDAPSDVIKDYLSYCLTVFSPPHEAVGMSLLDAKNDQTWYGGSITNYSDEANLVPGYYQKVTDANVSWIAEKLAKALPDIEALGVLNTPKGMQYALDQNLGGLADVILPMTTPGSTGILASLKAKYTVNPDKTNQYSTDMWDIYEKELQSANANDEFENDNNWYSAFKASLTSSNDKQQENGIHTIMDYYNDIKAYKEDPELQKNKKELNKKINEAYAHIAELSEQIVKDYKAGSKNSEPVQMIYASITAPADVKEYGFTQKTYAKTMQNMLRAGDEDGKKLALVKMDLTDEQKQVISERAISSDSNYSNYAEKYKALLDNGVTGKELSSVKASISKYDSSKAKILSVLNDSKYSGDKKTAIANVVGGSTSYTGHEELYQSLIDNGITADNLQTASESVEKYDSSKAKILSIMQDKNYSNEKRIALADAIGGSSGYTGNEETYQALIDNNVTADKLQSATASVDKYDSSKAKILSIMSDSSYGSVESRAAIANMVGSAKYTGNEDTYQALIDSGLNADSYQKVLNNTDKYDASKAQILAIAADSSLSSVQTTAIIKTISTGKKTAANLASVRALGITPESYQKFEDALPDSQKKDVIIATAKSVGFSNAQAYALYKYKTGR